MKIEFSEKEHKYIGHIKGEEKPLLNASLFKDKYKPEWKPFMASARAAKSSGGNAMKIMKGWNFKKKVHCEYGTAMHSTMQGYIEYNIIPDDAYLEYFLSKFQKLLDDMGVKKEDLKSEALEGNEKLLTGGLIDFHDGKTIYDLKTGNFHKKKKGNLKKPFNFLPNNPCGNATLQLNFYETFDGFSGMDKKVLYWDGRDFTVIEIDIVDKELLINEIKNYERS